MNIETFKYLIDYIDLNIKSFSNDFKNVSHEFDLLFKNQANILYERTLSVEANNCIKKFFLEENKNGLDIAVSEFNVRLIDQPDKIEEKKFLNEVKLESRPKWNNCYFDGYFLTNNFILEGKIHVFVEYKLKNEFDYGELAKDFLKFKIFTKNCDLNKLFVFIIFEKNCDYPTIKSENNNFYILNSNMSSENLSESRVYISTRK